MDLDEEEEPGHNTKKKNMHKHRQIGSSTSTQGSRLFLKGKKEAFRAWAWPQYFPQKASRLPQSHQRIHVQQVLNFSSQTFDMLHHLSESSWGGWGDLIIRSRKIIIVPTRNAKNVRQGIWQQTATQKSSVSVFTR